MRLYLDENIPVALASALVAHEVDCLTTRDAGNLGLSDDEQLGFAVQEQRILVTFNCRDFVQQEARWRETWRSHCGILLSKQLPLQELLCRFRHFMILYRERDLANRVVWLQKPKA